MIRSAGRKRFAHAGQSPTRCATMILLAHSDSRVHPRAAVWVPHRPKRLAGPEMKPSATCTKAQCKLHYIDADQAELMYSPSLANRRSLLSARGDVILINSNHIIRRKLAIDQCESRDQRPPCRCGACHRGW